MGMLPVNRFNIMSENWVDIEVSPDYIIRLMELDTELDYLLDSYSEVTVIFATLGVYLDDIGEGGVWAWHSASQLVVPRMHDFVKSHWGREVEIEPVLNNTLFSGLELSYFVFGVPSLVREEELEKFLEAEGISVTRQMRKNGKLQEMATKVLLTKWLEEGLKRSGTKDVLEGFKKRGIVKIEVYSIKDKKWVGNVPPNFDGDITEYLVMRAMSPFL